MKYCTFIIIDCGDFCCASEAGKLCSHVMTTNDDTIFRCGLFTDMNNSACENIILESKDGRLQRCAGCLEVFVKVGV